MQPAPRFDEVHVISDLHLGGEVPARQIFRQGSLLEKLVDSLTNRPKDRTVALVLNGDTVDFLAEPCARYFDPHDAVAKLEGLFRYEEFRPVWDALRRFVSKVRRTLIVNLGNHDLELALPWVRRRFVEELSGGDDRRRGRIELAFDGTGVRCHVGQAKVLCLHGNEVDTWNVTDFETLRRIGRDLQLGRTVEPWTPNAGSKLVVDLMNEVKRDLAFVDLLKPETKAVVPALLALKPEMAGRAADVLAVGARLTFDWLRRATGFLGDQGPESRDEPPVRTRAEAGQTRAEADQLLAGLVREAFPKSGPWVGETDVDQLFREVEDHLEAGGKPMDFIDADESGQRLGKLQALIDFVRGRETYQVLREALEGLQKDRGFDVRHVDETFRDLDELVAPEVDFLVAGHTHLERTLRRARGSGYYFNSGTWVRLVELTPDMLESDERFKPVWKVLEVGTLAALDAAADPRLVQDKPAVVSIVDHGDVVRGTLNRVVANPTGGVDLVPEGEVFERR